MRETSPNVKIWVLRNDKHGLRCKICTQTKPHQYDSQNIVQKCFPSRQKTTMFSASIEQCVLSPSHFNLHLEALGKNMIVLSDVVSRTCHTCVPVNHTPSRTNLTDSKCRLRRHGSMVNMISDSSLSYWGNIEKAEQYTRLQNTVFKWWLHKNQITDSRPVIRPSGPMILTQRN